MTPKRAPKRKPLRIRLWAVERAGWKPDFYMNRADAMTLVRIWPGSSRIVKGTFVEDRK